jgi:phosphatidylserine synthase
LLCAIIIEGCDGEVARLKVQEPAFGQKFDVITDNITPAAIVAGFALGLYRRSRPVSMWRLMAILLGELPMAGCGMNRPAGDAPVSKRPIQEPANESTR